MNNYQNIAPDISLNEFNKQNSLNFTNGYNQGYPINDYQQSYN